MPAYAPNRTTGYVSISDWLDQNRGTLGSEAGMISSGISDQLDAAKSAADQVAAGATPGVAAGDLPGFQTAQDKQTAAQTAANALTSGVGPGQLSSTLPGMGDRSFEAQLVNVAGAQPFAGVREKARTLANYLDKTTQAAYKPAFQGYTGAIDSPYNAQQRDRPGPPMTPEEQARRQAGFG